MKSLLIATFVIGKAAAGSVFTNGCHTKAFPAVILVPKIHRGNVSFSFQRVTQHLGRRNAVADEIHSPQILRCFPQIAFQSRHLAGAAHKKHLAALV